MIQTYNLVTRYWSFHNPSFLHIVEHQAHSKVVVKKLILFCEEFGSKGHLYLRIFPISVWDTNSCDIHYFAKSQN